jgi:hypothetical protein
MKLRCRENKYRKLEQENIELRQQLQESQAQLVRTNISISGVSNNTDSNNHSHNTTNNTMNANMNNTTNNIHIMSFGKEDFSQIFDDKKKRLNILKQKHSALLYRIEQSRCNKQYPELRNVVIKNLRSDVAHVYRDNVDPNNFVVMSITDVLDGIMNNDYTEIETDFEEIGHELDDKTREHTGEFIRQMNENPDKIREQKQSIKRMIYNLNRDVKIKDVSSHTENSEK